MSDYKKASDGLPSKEKINTDLFLYRTIAKWDLAGKNLMGLSHPSGHFLQSKVFSPVICLGFEVWGAPGQVVGLAGSYLC